MNFRVKRLTNQIVMLVFNDSVLMCKTMCRFAEHFESPQWRGKLFSWRQFKSWYSWDKGKFSYYEDWGGYNMPSSTFKAFRDGSFDPLTWGEKDVLKVTADLAEPFYLIAIPKEDDGDDCLRHELGHAFYHVDADYRLAANTILAGLPTETNGLLKEGIKLAGYNDEVLHDELHAYLIDGIRYLTDFTETRDRFPKRKYFAYWLAGRKMNKLLDRTLEKHNVKL